MIDLFFYLTLNCISGAALYSVHYQQMYLLNSVLCFTVHIWKEIRMSLSFFICRFSCLEC